MVAWRPCGRRADSCVIPARRGLPQARRVPAHHSYLHGVPWMARLPVNLSRTHDAPSGPR
ncbi:hypothetical protein SCOCK_10022 [Actinacidiphila cocklensis]|uniref:Uncharacterized protein n=1 Tax=Actinacidiphila cocklensis TaxID=887465 RepID=A0A9W4DFU3_9ACTN|nr:hypothetical protein SCOCK_10022 [Actinacidiphila cocklensis]